MARIPQSSAQSSSGGYRGGYGADYQRTVPRSGSSPVAPAQSVGGRGPSGEKGESGANPIRALRRFHFALAQRPYAACDVLVIGDSISEGTGATVRTRRWIDQFQDKLRRSFATTGVTGGEGFVKALYTTGTTFAPGWTYSGNLSGNGTFGFGRSCAVLKAPDGAAKRTVTGTSVKLLFVTSSSAGNVEVRYVATGGTLPTTANATFSATSSVSDARVNGVLTVTFPSRGTYDIQIKHVAASSGAGSGDVYFNGMWVYDGDETTGVRVTESAQHGSTSAQWTPGASLGSNSTNQDSYALTSGISLLNPDLVIIALGGNDRTTNVPVETYKANLKSLIQVIKGSTSPSPSILLLGEYQEGTGINQWPSYLDAQQSIADEDPNYVTFYSLYDRFPLSSDNTLGWVYTDGVHPSDAGHATIAEFLSHGIRPR